jgi:hypothetical protein
MQRKATPRPKHPSDINRLQENFRVDPETQARLSRLVPAVSRLNGMPESRVTVLRLALVALENEIAAGRIPTIQSK